MSVVFLEIRILEHVMDEDYGAAIDKLETLYPNELRTFEIQARELLDLIRDAREGK